MSLLVEERPAPFLHHLELEGKDGSRNQHLGYRSDTATDHDQVMGRDVPIPYG